MLTFELLGTEQRLGVEETAEGYVFHLLRDGVIIASSPLVTREAVQTLVYSRQRMTSDIFAVDFDAEHGAYEFAFNAALPRRVVLCPAEFFESGFREPHI